MNKTLHFCEILFQLFPIDQANVNTYINLSLSTVYQRIVNNIFDFLTASVGSMYLLSLSEKVEYLFENYPMCECLHLMENGCSVVAEQA